MKKITISLMIILFSILMICIGIYLIQNQTIKKSFINYNGDNGDNIFIRCNYNILEPEFTYAVELNLITDNGIEINKKMLSFHKIKKIFSQTELEWKNSRIGGTTVENTTFPELVKMVKQDCSQFQDNYYDESELGYTSDMNDNEKLERWNNTELKNPNWTFYENKPKTEEELKEEEERKKEEEFYESMTEEELEARRQAILKMYQD